MSVEVYYWGRPITPNRTTPGAITRPELVPCLSGIGESGISHVSCGQRHAAVLAGGEIFVWGLSESTVPQRMPFGPYCANSLACGRSTVWAVSRTHDHIWVWDLEEPSKSSNTSWCNRLPKSFIKRPADFGAIVAGAEHLLIQLEEAGTLFSLGKNTHGQRGIGEVTSPSPEPYMEVPRLCCFKDKMKIEKVAAGYQHTLAVSTEGVLFSWGCGLQGQLGNGEYCSEKVSPESVPFFHGSVVRQIACGNNHSLVINERGMLFSFGENSKGQLGLGDYENRHTPSLVTIDSIAQIAAGCTSSHSLAVTTTNSVYSWGSNDNGQLGLGDTLDRSTPTEIATLKGKEVIANLACSSSGSLCVIRYHSSANLPGTSAGLFTTLHPNVLIKVLSLLDAENLCNLCCTCHTMNYFASSNLLWKNLYESRHWSRPTAFLMDTTGVNSSTFRGNWKKVYRTAFFKETSRTTSSAICVTNDLQSKSRRSLLSSVFSYTYSWLSKSATPRRILVLGLDAAGKTTMLYRLKINEIVSTIPSIGFNVETVEFKNFHLVVWDISGYLSFRPLWQLYYQGAVGIIFVVDSADLERFEEARTEFHTIMQSPELAGLPVLFYANKQDLPGCMSPSNVAAYFSVPMLTQLGHPYQMRGSCALTGDGLYEGFEWICKMSQS